MKKQQKNLGQLFVPICLEIMFYMLAGVVDTLMLSTVGDQAVGAVGTANTYIGMFIIMFSIISSGMIAVMTQYIGAGKNGIAYQARQIGLIFNAVLGVGMSIMLFLCSEMILKTVGIADSLLPYAVTYLKIVGGFSILNAIIPIFSSYLRAFGFTKQPLAATVCGNIINLILNSIFLFVFHLGVAGVETDGTTDALVRQAVITYFLMNFGEPENYGRLKKSYDEQKAQLATCTGYTRWLVE